MKDRIAELMQKALEDAERGGAPDGTECCYAPHTCTKPETLRSLVRLVVFAQKKLDRASKALKQAAEYAVEQGKAMSEAEKERDEAHANLLRDMLEDFPEHSASPKSNGGFRRYLLSIAKERGLEL